MDLRLGKGGEGGPRGWGDNGWRGGLCSNTQRWLGTVPRGRDRAAERTARQNEILQSGISKTIPNDVIQKIKRNKALRQLF